MIGETQWSEHQFVDISEPKYGVQITVREDGSVLWVSVDGITVCRVSRVAYLELNLPDMELITYGEVDEGTDET